MLFVIWQKHELHLIIPHISTTFNNCKVLSMASLNPRSGPLGNRLAAHLLRRASFNITRSRIDQFSLLTAAEALDLLVVPYTPSIAEPIDPETNDHWINSGVPPLSANFRLKGYVSAWWMDEARQDPTINSKMCFFLHSNFITSNSFLTSYFHFDYQALLRYYALGNFRILAQKIVVDNLMLKYLNGDQNHKNNPNENFAREFFELFTIGKGPQQGPGDYTNYTEGDIQEAARLLTGFRKGTRDVDIDPETGIPMGKAVTSYHDTGDKQFSYAFQDQIIPGSDTIAGMFGELQEFVSMIFNQEETARFICRKIYRYFVSRQIDTEIETDIIEPLAVIFRDSDYSLKATMAALLKSEHFYDEDDSASDDEIIGSLMKSPMENVLQSLSYLNLDIPNPITAPLNHYETFYRKGVLLVMLSYAGMELFDPDSPAGYPAYYQQPDYHRSWFNSGSIIARYKLPQMLLEGQRILAGGDLGGVQLNMVEFVENVANITDAGDANILVTELLEYMFCEVPDQARFDYFLDLFLDGLSPINWFFEWQNYLNTGVQDSVIIPLSNLIQAIMYSPEYQVS